jgi:hypothetical protein
MKNDINKAVLDALELKFGGIFASEILQKVADDGVKVVEEDVAKLIKSRAVKGVSKSSIIKQYLVEPAPVSSKTDASSKSKKTPDLPNIGSDLDGKSTNLTGGQADVK